MRRLTVLLVSATSLPLALSATPALAGATEDAAAPTPVGRWLLDVVSPTRTTPNALNSADKGVLDADTTVRRTYAPAGATGKAGLYFPGWDDGTGDGLVDAGQSSVRIADKATFNPDAKSFTISINVRPKDPKGVPGVDPADDLNIVQKGTSAGGGKLWKVSMNAKMQPVCEFVGKGSPAGTSNRIRVKPATTTEARMTAFPTPPSGTATAPRGGYNITCSLRQGQARLVLTEIAMSAGKVVQTRRYDSGLVGPAIKTGGTAGPNPAFTVANTDEIWIGKKPADTDAGNAFSGVIDDLELFKAS